MRKEQMDPKLTGALSRLYAEWRPMSEKGVELEPPKRPQEKVLESGLILPKGVDVPEGYKRRSTGELERRHEAPRSRERQQAEESEKRRKREGLAEGVPGAGEFLEHTLEHGGRDIDKGFSFMLAEINEHTRRRPLKEWRDDRIALYYQEWSDVVSYLNEDLARKDLSSEEANKNRDMLRMAEGIKKALLAQAKDKVSVIAGGVDEGDRPVNANKIKNKEVQKEFIKLLAKLEHGELKTAEQIQKVRQQWYELSIKMGKKLKNDPEAKRAFERIRAHLVVVSKELQARREQKPVRHQARAEIIVEQPKKVEQIEHVESRESVEDKEMGDTSSEAERVRISERRRRYAENPSLPAEEAEKDFRQYQARVGDMAAKESAKKEQIEKGREAWKEEKKNMKSIRDMKAELSKNPALWERYGWTSGDRQAVIKVLGLEQKQADAVCQALLLQGMSGAEGKELAIELLSKAKDGKNEQVSLHVAKTYINDEDVLKALRIPPKLIDEALEQEYQKDPLSTQELAWQISSVFPDTFGENGENPIWERRYREVVDERGNIRLEEHEVVRSENFMLWFRDRINFKQEQGPSERYNFYQEVKLDKKYGSPISLSKMLDNTEKMFAGSLAERVPDEFLPDNLKGTTVKESYSELSEMLQVEAYLVTMVRQLHLEYDENKGSEEEITKKIQQLFDKNHMTKEVWGNKPLWQFMTLLPEKFDKLNNMDGSVGASVVKNYLAYYHISDFDALRGVLGEDAKLFTIEGLREARDKVSGGGKDYGDKQKDADTHYYDFSCKWDEAERRYKMNDKDLDQAFDVLEVDAETGQVTKSEVRKTRRKEDEDKKNKTWKDPEKQGRKAFIKLVNIFGSYTPDPRLEKTIKKAILEDASAGEGLSDTNKEYAHLIADHLTRFTGAAAYNDTKFVGYDAFTRLMHTQGYREKMLKGERRGLDDDEQETWMANRGGKVGNIHTIAQFRQLVVGPMLAITTLSEEKASEGRAGYNKPIIQVLEELNQERDGMKRAMKGAEEEGRTEKEKEKLKEEWSEKYRDVARQMHFKKNAEQHYLNNMFNRGVKINEWVRGGKGIEFESYWGYSTEIGSWFNTQKFQQDFIAMVTDVRYAFSTYGDLSYAMPVRGYNYENGEWEWMAMADQMFGEWMLNIPEFKKENGEIDPNRVTKKSHLLYKQFLLTYIAGEFIAARQFNKWSSTPRHGMEWYESVIEILEKIPGDIEISGKDIGAADVPEYFFPKHMINWLRKETGTTKANLYGWAGMKNILLGGRKGKKEESVWDGISEALGLFLGGVFKA